MTSAALQIVGPFRPFQRHVQCFCTCGYTCPAAGTSVAEPNPLLVLTLSIYQDVSASILVCWHRTVQLPVTAQEGASLCRGNIYTSQRPGSLVQSCNPCQSPAAPSFLLCLSILSTLRLTTGQAAEIDLTFSSSSCSNEQSGGDRHDVSKTCPCMQCVESMAEVALDWMFLSGCMRASSACTEQGIKARPVSWGTLLRMLAASLHCLASMQ